MNESSSPSTCPHCGSHQLIAHQNSRRVFINHADKRIPLLTVHFHLDNPVIEENCITYTCSCSWSGSENDLMTEG